MIQGRLRSRSKRWGWRFSTRVQCKTFFLSQLLRMSQHKRESLRKLELLHLESNQKKFIVLRKFYRKRHGIQPAPRTEVRWSLLSSYLLQPHNQARKKRVQSSSSFRSTTQRLLQWSPTTQTFPQESPRSPSSTGSALSLTPWTKSRVCPTISCFRSWNL